MDWTGPVSNTIGIFLPLIISCSVSSEERKKMVGRVVVESDDIRVLGLKYDAFKENEILMADADDWTRVRKPDVGTLKSYIFWEMDSVDDDQRSENKIVRYNFYI